ncbi:MAG: ABC transporter permease [Roseovarius sp.]
MTANATQEGRAAQFELLPGKGLTLVRLAVWPPLAWIGAFFFIPIGFMLAISTWTRARGGLDPAWTLDNYEKILTRSYLLEGLTNSIEVALITTAISVIVAYPIAYVLAYRVPIKWQRVLLILAILPFWTSYLVRSYAWTVVLGDLGIVNVLLSQLGLISEPLILNYTRAATVLGFVHFFVMLLTLTIYANLVQISPLYRHAAADLGASGFQCFWRITLPLSLPGIMVGAFLTFVVCIGDYITPQILGGGNELLLPQSIIIQIQRTGDLPMAAAMSVVLMLTVTCAYFLTARWLRLDRL